MSTYEEARSRLEVLADEQLKRRVLAGIKVLEEHVGPDWVERIDPGSLCMGSTTSCILGQVYENVGKPTTFKEPYLDWWDGVEPFWKGLRVIDGEVESNPEKYGFSIDDEADSDYDWDELRDGWLIAIGHEGTPLRLSNDDD